VRELARGGTAFGNGQERIPDRPRIDTAPLEGRPGVGGGEVGGCNVGERKTGAFHSGSKDEMRPESTANAARLRAFIGQSAVHSIQDQIGLSLDPELLTGVHARLRIAPKFDVSYHLSGNVLGLDPALADSLLVKRIAAIRSRLITERVFDLQKAFGPPDEITRIAVIHPYQSASWADLHGELRRLEKLGLL
jgi:exodeoxyribonuclease VII large subunit